MAGNPVLSTANKAVNAEMTDKLKESLSAVIDGEADEFELRRVFDEAARNDELTDTWHRYHLISTIMRGEDVARPTLRGSVLQAMSDESESRESEGLALVSGGDAAADEETEKGARRTGPLGPILGMAVAAAVAMAVVVFVDPGSNSELPAVAASSVIELATPPAATLASDTRAADAQRTQAYLIHHVQQTAMNRGRVVSFAKVATYEQGAGQQQSQGRSETVAQPQGER